VNGAANTVQQCPRRGGGGINILNKKLISAQNKFQIFEIQENAEILLF
jgi:hypothetical protein